MKRLTLKDSVTITGPSAVAFGLFAKQQVIEMRPLSLSEMQGTKSKNGTGWYWKTSDGTLVPIDMSMVREAQETRAKKSPAIKLHPWHYLYFQYGKERLNGVEHILALKTFGLDGVVIEALKGSDWVPYDGRAKMYWKAIRNHLKYDGHLMPMAMQLQHTYEDRHPKFGWARSVTLNSKDERDELAVKVTVDYPRLGGEEIIEHRFPADDWSNMADIFNSRPLLQPVHEAISPLIKALGWPHAENLLKSSDFNKENPEPFKREITLHRMLDLLGPMALLAEAGTYVTGRIETDKGNHETDIRFLRQLKPIARQMYPDLECLAPIEPSVAAPDHSFLWRAVVRKSVPHYRQEL